MKTFEERYTAWIDDGLEGSALAAFEQELARRSAAAEAQADKADAVRLRTLLREQLSAPALTNGEFFSLQIRERIEAERAASRQPEPAPRAPWVAWLTWPVLRVAGLGAALVFVGAALYYGMMPPHAGGPAETTVARNATGAQNGTAVVAQASEATPAAANAGRAPRSGDDLMAKNDSPAPDVIDDGEPGFAARVPDPATTNATATPLHYRDANVNVLWINGLDYMPNVPDEQGVGSPAVSPGPAATDAHHG